MTLIQEHQAQTAVQAVVNDFSIQVATVNGSGSQSANNILMRSIFRMGIPVSGKNLFPSNIAGLPTWFTIRANARGYIARKKESDVLVCLNPNTVAEDIREVRPGAAIVYRDEFEGLIARRSDCHFYPVPLEKLVSAVCADSKLKKLVVNMVYVGVLAELLSIDMQTVEQETRKMFGRKAKALEMNLAAVHQGADWAKEGIAKTDPFRLQRMDKTAGKIIIDGNAASALGSIFGGCSVVTWYPITPSSSLAESLTDYAKKYRVDPKTGKACIAIVQAEDEIAAIGMALGAGWGGARSMTCTSGPGISLMGEFAGLSYFADVPTVVFDVQRIGPSTGLPTRTAQGDLLQVAFLSHGDTQHIMLFPGSVEECFALAVEAFDLAERFQTIVFVMSDLDLGMNNWMADPFAYPEKPFDRGKVLSPEDLDRLQGKWERYRDVDGDGIGWRTIPGTEHKAAGYFTRGSGHNERAVYTEKPQDYLNLMGRLKRKYESAQKALPKPVVSESAGARVGLIAFGSTHWALVEARDQLAREAGLETSYLRLRAYPFDPSVREFVAKHDRVYVVEQNRDGQMAQLLRLECPEHAARIRSVLHYNGLPVDARSVTSGILGQEKE